MAEEIQNKTALITGGTRGIGRAAAIALAKKGVRIAVCARGSRDPQETVREVEKLGVPGFAVIGDVRHPAVIQQVVDQVTNRYGGIDILVNNAGGEPEARPDFERASDLLWQDTLDLNTFSAIRFTRLVLPHMNQQRWGRVIGVASVQGREGGGRPWYNLAKSAIISLMKTLAMNPRYVRRGITFNSVAPGAILSEGNDWDRFRLQDPESFNEALEKRPMGRLGTPDEVAAVIAFLCSDQARFVNGACIAVDGGESRSF